MTDPNAFTPEHLAVIRRGYARQMLGLVGVADPRIEHAFARVAREAFLSDEPWQMFRFPYGYQTLPVNDPVHVYQDLVIALAKERGVNNGSPSLHARMMHALDVHAGDRVAHIGAGAGYFSAILAELAGPEGQVTAVEFDPALAARATENLRPYRTVTVVCGDGTEFPRETTDRVYVNFAIAQPADAWVERLAPGGRALFPLGVAAPDKRHVRPSHSARGAAFMIERQERGFAATHVCPAYFVCAEGALSADDALQSTLWAAFGRGSAELVKSLRWKTDAAPERCWFWSPRWSLSYDPPA